MSEGPARTWRARHHAALGLLVLAALALLLPFRDYLTDDTFIHLQFAKHVLRGEGFAFNANQPTYGATSPLWVGLLSASGAAAPGAAATPPDALSLPPLARIAKAWGAFFTAASVVLMAALARALGWDPRWSLAAAAFVALDAWSLRWGISGMETPLALTLAILSLVLLARGLVASSPDRDSGGASRRIAGAPFLAGLAVGLGFLARPEFLLLYVLGACALFWGSARAARVRRAAAFKAGALLAAVPWLALAWLWFHRLLPNTSAAKAGAWLDAERGLAAVRESIRALLAVDLVPIAIAVIALAWLRPWRAIGENRGRRAFWAAVFAWPALLVLGFAAGGVQVVSRYLVPATPAVVLIGLAALRDAARAWTPRRRAAALLTATLLFAAQNLYVTFAVSAPHARRHTAGLRDSLAALGLWARARTEPGTLFAVSDIGAFGYYSDRPVLDLFGLVTPRMARVTVKDGYDAVVWNLLFEPMGRPPYLIDRATRPARLTPPDDPSTPYRFIFARSIPDLGITRPTPYVYSLYAIDWNLYDRLHPRVARE